MIDNYNEIYVLHDKEDENIEIQPQYVYLTIPASFVCVYHKLLIYMADLGKTIIDDCEAVCKGNTKNIINCWNIFQSAIASHELGKTQEAQFFINYISDQLTNIYKGTLYTEYTGSFPITISDDGKIKAIVSCNDNVSFDVDVETGMLYQEYLDNKKEGKIYSIEEENLIVKDNNN